MRERFSSTELTALRNDLLQGGLIDSREAAELLQVFLMGRGYGVSPQAAMDAVKKWKFSPAMRDDKPVAVQIKVEVNFHLY